MSFVTLQLASYQLPALFQLLSDFGFSQLPPKDDFEVYRGQLKSGGMIIIYHTGKVIYQDKPLVKQLVAQAVDQLLIPTHAARRTYAVLARTHQPNKPVKFHDQHLNIWLTPVQYAQALDTFYETPDFHSIYSADTHIDAIFRTHRHEIEFHNNGKVISKSGFQVFSPLLRQIIEDHQPFADYDLIIGQDEVGSGERIGPLVVSTTALSPRQMINLQLAGIKDSKMIPMSIIEAMGHRVTTSSTVSYSWVMPPDDFDGEYEATQGIVELLWQGHSALAHKVIHDLEYYGKRVLVLIDEFSKNLHQFTQAFNDLQVEVKLLPHGELQSTSVAAASILAKAKRYRWIQVNEKVYGMKFKRKNIKSIATRSFASNILKW